MVWYILVLSSHTIKSTIKQYLKSEILHKNTLLSPFIDVAEMEDFSRPMYNDRLDTPLPDKPFKDVLTAAEKSIKQKEKGPWTQLSQEEKVACKL